MQILVLNSGSSSIKFQLFTMPKAEVICSGLVERIGQENAILNYKTKVVDQEETLSIPSHKVGLEYVAQKLLDENIGVIKDANEISAVGHRVVHGGSAFAETVMITDEVKQQIKTLAALAP